MPVDLTSALAGFNARVDAAYESFEAIEAIHAKLKVILSYEHHHGGLPDAVISRVTDLVYGSKFDEQAILRGLIVEIISAFEQFSKHLITSLVSWQKSKTKSFQLLDETFRKQYIASAASTLRHFPSGTVNGVKFDFDRLMSTLASCLQDQPDYDLDGVVFTISSGNPTAGRLVGLFEKVGLSDPFTIHFGQSLLDAGWVTGISQKGAADKGASQLDKYLDDRNDIVHGLGAAGPTQSDFLDLFQFFKTLADALASETKRQAI